MKKDVIIGFDPIRLRFDRFSAAHRHIRIIIDLSDAVAYCSLEFFFAQTGSAVHDKGHIDRFFYCGDSVKIEHRLCNINTV